jgi:hypothetical protein
MIHQDIPETYRTAIEFISIILSFKNIVLSFGEMDGRDSLGRFGSPNRIKTDSADAEELSNLRRQARVHQGTLKTLRDEIRALEKGLHEQKAEMQCYINAKDRQISELEAI